jgi:hypothetical protein
MLLCACAPTCRQHGLEHQGAAGLQHGVCALPRCAATHTRRLSPSPPGAAFTLLREGDAFVDEEHNLLIAVERIVPCTEQPLVSAHSCMWLVMWYLVAHAPRQHVDQTAALSLMESKRDMLGFKIHAQQLNSMSPPPGAGMCTASMQAIRGYQLAVPLVYRYGHLQYAVC